MAKTTLHPLQGQINNGSFTAGADLSARQYTAVKQGTVDGEVIGYDGSGQVMGILQNSPLLGETAAVALPGGAAYMEMAAALAGSSLVKADSNGKGVAATTLAGDWTTGLLGPRSTNTASGDVVPIQVLAYTHSTGA